jgi:hypothetical protein
MQAICRTKCLMVGAEVQVAGMLVFCGWEQSVLLQAVNDSVTGSWLCGATQNAALSD